MDLCICCLDSGVWVVLQVSFWRDPRHGYAGFSTSSRAGVESFGAHATSSGLPSLECRAESSHRSRSWALRVHSTTPWRFREYAVLDNLELYDTAFTAIQYLVIRETRLCYIMVFYCTIT